MEANSMIFYAVIGESGTSNIVYDYLAPTQSQKNYSAVSLVYNCVVRQPRDEHYQADPR